MWALLTSLSLTLSPQPAAQPPPDQASEVVGSIAVLSYNVAGLMDFVSESTPSINHGLIGPRLNAFDLALVQESFHYARRLERGTVHPFKIRASTEPWPILEGDGLAAFSHQPLGVLERVRWVSCNGIFSAYNDCLAEKGMTALELELAPGVWVDVYNVHLDAGDDEGDVATRGEQIRQLVNLIAARSQGRAVIVGGDTNIDTAAPADRRNLDLLMAEAGLIDGCQALACGDERIDRVLFRSGDGVHLVATRWWIPSGFVDGEGQPLSDHDPVAVQLEWHAEVSGAPLVAKLGGGEGKGDARSAPLAGPRRITAAAWSRVVGMAPGFDWVSPRVAFDQRAPGALSWMTSFCAPPLAPVSTPKTESWRSGPGAWPSQSGSR